MTEKLRTKGRSRILPRLLRCAAPYWYLFFAAILMTVFSNQLALLGPRYSGAAIDALAAPEGVQMPVIRDSLLRMGLCYLLSAVFGYLLSILMVYAAQQIVRNLRRQLFDKLMSLPVSFFDTNTTGDIVSHITYDIDTMSTSFSNDLVQVLSSIYSVLGALWFMWDISLPLLLVSLITVPALILIARHRSRIVRPMFHARSKKLGELNGFSEEMLSGSRSIAVYNQEDTFCSRFSVQNQDATDATCRAEVNASVLFPITNLINNISLTLIVIAGGALYMYSQGGRVQAGSLFFITLGGLAQFVQYSRKFSGPITEFANIMHEIQSAFSAAERVFEILDLEPEKPDAPDAAAPETVQGHVKFDDVCFSYVPGEPILHHVSFEARPGQVIAIVGPTGAGKTTIISLLMRFYDVNSGVITLDGRPLSSLPRAALRRAFTMVLQDSWLFHGTIRENIAYGREDAGEEAIIAAAKAARIHPFIEHLPEGYDTVLSDDGSNLSKGQRQLLTIARAMLSDAPMLILDEATSNIDSRTELLLQQALADLMRGRTCFVIAHRLSTIRNADRILVLQDGTVSEQGSHDELMAQGGFYSRLYNAQFQ